MRTILNKNPNKTVAVWLLAGVLGGCSVFSPSPSPEPQAPQVVPPVVAPAHRAPRLGLALGGGAARGFAHVGVIQVLAESGIHPDLVVGTSAGSLVAALYASGMAPAEL